MINQSNLTRKLLISLFVVTGLVTTWFIRHSLVSNQSQAERMAASLLPDSDQPVQLGAYLSPEAIEIGNPTTLTLILRNNQTTVVKPKLTVQLPPSLRFEETRLDSSLLFNVAEQTLYWYPTLVANGGLAMQEFHFLALQPTSGEQGRNNSNSFIP
ncbi:MAG: hypothetical protein IPL78_28950 [Chloroflexi bacterium]|nr:hypothetical protein [Chloroflexota bacterium]